MGHLPDIAKTVVQDPAKAWEIAKTVAQLSAKLFDFRKTLKSSEEKHQVDEILDTLSELKQSAGKLEDENRELREKLRFKSDEYEFRNPFWYAKGKSDPLCPKCFAGSIPAPMAEPSEGDDYRVCLVCHNHVDFVHDGAQNQLVNMSNRARVRRRY